MSDKIPPIIGEWNPLRTEKRRKIISNQARKILELCNAHNRPMPSSTVEKVSDALLNGKWKYNGEPIIFGTNGGLLDGQGRLTACAETGVPLITDVAFGHEPATFDTIDRGKIRNEADDLALSGEKNTRSLAAALRVICAYMDGCRGSNVISTPYTFQRMRETLEKYPGIRDSVHFSNTHKQKIICAPRAVATVHFFSGLDATEKVLAKRDEFFSRLIDGTNLAAGDPVLAVREKFISMTRSPDARVRRNMGGLTTIIYLHTLTRGWNAYIGGYKLTKIQVPYTDVNKTVPGDLPDIKNGYRMLINREVRQEQDELQDTVV